MCKFSFASVNMRRRNAAMHVLLNDNMEEDLLCIQEPWFNLVGMACCDDMFNGKDILGGAANPRWRLAYPSFTNGQRAKVMTYIRLHDRLAKFKPNHCQLIVHNDLASHPCLLITDIHTGTYYWHVINFYNDVDDPSVLDALLGLDLDATIPTLLMGDFNLHSTTWSPTGWVTSWDTHRLEEWVATQTLDLLTKPQIPTCMGEGRARNSTLDLVWCNMAAQIQGTFTGAEVDFGSLQGSDHALICTIASTPCMIHQPKVDRMEHFVSDIDAEAWEEWDQILSFELPPLISLSKPQSVDAYTNDLYHAFNEACKATMKKVSTAPGFNSRWWNNECRATAQAMRGGFWTEEEQHVANQHLKKVVQNAKQDWANKYITMANVWEVAAWRHGRRSSHIPALRDLSGSLVYDHKGMASLLSARFFAVEEIMIPTMFEDDPAPLPTWEFVAFNEDELYSLLRVTSNVEAPGTLGIGWKLLKRGWDTVKEHLLLIYNACLHLGHHPVIP
jgi:hypothetical protein